LDVEILKHVHLALQFNVCRHSLLQNAGGGPNLATRGRHGNAAVFVHQITNTLQLLAPTLAQRDRRSGIMHRVLLFFRSNALERSSLLSEMAITPNLPPSLRRGFKHG
jgi:hypothetical protein